MFSFSLTLVSFLCWPLQQRQVLLFAVPQPCLDVAHNVVRGGGMKILVTLDKKDFGVTQGAVCRGKLGSVGCLCLTHLGAWIPNLCLWEQPSPRYGERKGWLGMRRARQTIFLVKMSCFLSQGCTVAITLVGPLPSDIFQVEGKSRECHVRNANKNVFLDFLLLCTVCQNLHSPLLLFCLWMRFMLLCCSSGKRRITCCEFT